MAMLASTKIENACYLSCPSIVAIVISYPVYVGLNSKKRLRIASIELCCL